MHHGVCMCVDSLVASCTQSIIMCVGGDSQIVHTQRATGILRFRRICPCVVIPPRLQQHSTESSTAAHSMLRALCIISTDTFALLLSPTAAAVTHSSAPFKSQRDTPGCAYRMPWGKLFVWGKPSVGRLTKIPLVATKILAPAAIFGPLSSVAQTG